MSKISGVHQQCEKEVWPILSAFLALAASAFGLAGGFP
jgi:hypothetical protein